MDHKLQKTYGHYDGHPTQVEAVNLKDHYFKHFKGKNF